MENNTEEINLKRCKEIEAELEILQYNIGKFNETLNFNSSFDKYEQAVYPITKQIDNLDREYRLIVAPKFDNLPPFGHTMNLKTFIFECNDGNFTDYDGHGYYIKDNKMSNIVIIPSDIKHNSIRSDFDDMIWFNK